jgi:hypothetical protein
MSTKRLLTLAAMLPVFLGTASHAASFDDLLGMKPPKLTASDATRLAKGALSDIPGSLAIAGGFLGITPDQQGRWDTFGDALVAFLQTSVPPQVARRMGLVAQEATVTSYAGDLDDLLAGTMRKLDAMSDLRRATTDLAQSLRPDQTKTLERYLDALPMGIGSLLTN